MDIFKRALLLSFAFFYLTNEARGTDIDLGEKTEGAGTIAPSLSLKGEQRLPQLSIKKLEDLHYCVDIVAQRFIDAGMQRKEFCVYGNGTQTRDFTYIEDEAEAIYQLFTLVLEGKSSLYQELNCCTGQETTISTLANIIINLVKNKKSKITYEDLPTSRKDYEVNRRFGDNFLLKQLTNIKEFTPLQEGLKNCISFWQTNTNFQL